MGQFQWRSSLRIANQKPPEPHGRLDYLDNFRTFLTMIVIYHHMAIPYGGLGSWIYTSRIPFASFPLMAFNAINQTYFMGSFFFLSGYFSARVWKKKGTAAFLQRKWVKLGIPAVVYTILAEPIQIALLMAYADQKLGFGIFPSYWRQLRGLRGPVWYCALALIFDIIYAFLPTLPDISSLGLLPILVLEIAASFLIRLWYPVGTTIQLLNLQPAYLPQYISCYALGASLQSPTPPFTETARNNLMAASIASFASILVLYSPAPYPDQIASLFGGPNLLAFAYAVWNETTGYLLGNLILRVFITNKWLNRRWGIARAAYAAFLLHPVVCVAMQVWWDGWGGGGVV